MKKYFIYFSATGNGDYIAEALKEYDYTPLKIEMEKKIKKVGFFFILKYGGRATFKKKEKIKPFELELKEDDLVVIGSPIWSIAISVSLVGSTQLASGHHIVINEVAKVASGTHSHTTNFRMSYTFPLIFISITSLLQLKNSKPWNYIYITSTCLICL